MKARNQAEGMSKPLILLTDIPDWVEGLHKTLLDRGCAAEVVDLTALNWEPSAPPLWQESLIFNRLSANTAGGRISSVTKARDILASLELAGTQIVNGLTCQLVASSKALQSAVFEQAGVGTPATKFVEKGRDWNPGSVPQLAKPNISGFGRGISMVTNGSPLPYSEDACAIVQNLVQTDDQKVHRVELLEGRVLYRSTTPLLTGQFDYCLAGAKQVELFSDCPRSIETKCARIAKLAKMDVGSLEYLIAADGEPCFIDINPVSSFAPQAQEQLGFSPMEKLADFLMSRLD